MKKLTLIATLCLLMILSVQAEKKQTLTINGQTIEKIATRITFDGDVVLFIFSVIPSRRYQLLLVPLRST